MHKSSSILLIALALLACSAPALAAYKCEVAGKTVYSDAPCADSVHTKEIQLQPNSRDANDAQQRLQQDKKELQRLESARKKQEATDQKAWQRARKTQQAREKKCKELALRAKWAREDADHASGRSREKAQRNAQRAEEKYQLSCDANS
jgi:type IV secretory pathway VirB10-like protein